MSEKKENIKNGTNIIVDNGNITVINEGISLSEKKEEKKENINTILASDDTKTNVDLTPDVKLTPEASNITVTPEVNIPSPEVAPVNIEPVIPEVVTPEVNIPSPAVEPEVSPSLDSVTMQNDTPIINNDISLADNGDAFYNTPTFNDSSINNNFDNSNMNNVTSSYNSFNTSYSDSNPIYDLLDEIENGIISVTKEKIAEAKEKAKESVNNLDMYKQMSNIFSNFVGGSSNNRKL